LKDFLTELTPEFTTLESSLSAVSRNLRLIKLLRTKMIWRSKTTRHTINRADEALETELAEIT